MPESPVTLTSAAGPMSHLTPSRRLLDFPLGCPSEGEAQVQPEAVGEWVQACRAFECRGELVWCERRWQTLGSQRLLLYSAKDVAAWVGEEQRWRQARCHYQRLITQ